MTARLAADRGTTEISERVLEAIASRAAAETPGVGGVDGAVLGVRVGGRPPHASASADGDVVRPRVRVSVAYPASVREVTRQARLHIQERLGTLTGLRVGPVDIDVAALTSEKPARGRRVS
ncbi:Asp23/Gls24 family envelope stress response protein [Spirillospora sp. NPDC047279]|uniref:Asp23/Gls24 family envelope stress response protein n=1 Tax=Spirillospora sp. NPDC047279 TaxID=3155478 RepID=UPI0033E08AC8